MSFLQREQKIRELEKSVARLRKDLEDAKSDVKVERDGRIKAEADLEVAKERIITLTN